MPTRFDLCLAWNWEHDAAFVELLDAACRARGRSLLQVTLTTLEVRLAELRAGKTGFASFLDRASESDPRFLAMTEVATASGARSINPYDAARRSWDKVTMHEALFAVVRTPYTIVLPSHGEDAELASVDLTPLGPRFAIKPSHGGGGDGVVLGARTLADVLAARQQFPADRYLLQTQVQPAHLGGRAAWLRVLYCLGEVYPCWWDPTTHVYAPLTSAEESHFHLGGVRAVTETIARVCGLRLFSTEIALADDGGLVVVDYANDPIDLRLQSRCREGVPDDIARFVATTLAAHAG
jgi:hypothetical protein